MMLMMELDCGHKRHRCSLAGGTGKSFPLTLGQIEQTASLRVRGHSHKGEAGASVEGRGGARALTLASAGSPQAAPVPVVGTDRCWDRWARDDGWQGRGRPSEQLHAARQRATLTSGRALGSLRPLSAKTLGWRKQRAGWRNGFPLLR